MSIFEELTHHDLTWIEEERSIKFYFISTRDLVRHLKLHNFTPQHTSCMLVEISPWPKKSLKELKFNDDRRSIGQRKRCICYEYIAEFCHFNVLLPRENWKI